ncbi:FecCD family ABC transporter permease [Plantibacter sp. Mn2098]|uniref:FecCD family ABC transporter permease n=1 Tax=Plantibacter sp. Mn2098 TaxID=3395266 RepID=UPI003BE97E17
MPVSELVSQPASTVLAAGARRRRRIALGLATAIASLVVVIVLSLMIGARPLSPAEVLAGLVDPRPGSPEAVVASLRWPRTMVGLLVGASLGLAGAVVQVVTRNPIADPGVLGINAGAALAVAIVVAAGAGGSPGALLLGAFCGSLVVATTVVVLALRSGRRGNPLESTLVGVAIAAVLTGVTVAIGLADPMAFARMQGWLAGSIAVYDVSLPAASALVVLVATVALICCARGLGAVQLGEDVARSFGVPVGRITLLAVLIAALLASAATAVAGPIAFIGLVAPLIARAFAGPRFGWVLGLSAVFGAVVVVLADIVGRVLLTDGEVPAGIVATFIGGPALIVAVRSGRLEGRR